MRSRSVSIAGTALLYSITKEHQKHNRKSFGTNPIYEVYRDASKWLCLNIYIVFGMNAYEVGSKIDAYAGITYTTSRMNLSGNRKSFTFVVHVSSPLPFPFRRFFLFAYSSQLILSSV